MLVLDLEWPGELRAKVLDFGIAKLSEQANGPDGKVQTETGTMIGTPAYMAPEQCLADPNLDGKADVYALGIMLYEMLAARLPFTAQHSFDFMAAHVRGQPRPLGEVAPQVPPEVTNLCHTMMAKSPAERPSMEAVVMLLDQLRTALPAIWAMPRLSGPYQRVSRESLAIGATALGPPSPHASKELIELGATVAGTPTPGGRLSKDAPARPDSFPPSARSQFPSATPLASAASAVPPAGWSTPPPAGSQSTPPVASTASHAANSKSRSTLPWLAGVATLLIGVLLVVRFLTGPTATAPIPSAPPRAVKWVVRSVPVGAEVMRADGQLLGTTPWEIEHPAGAGETVIRLHRPGFQDKTMVLSHSTDVKTELLLEPVPTPPVLTPPTAPPPESPERNPGAKRRKTRARSADPKSKNDDVQLLLD